MQFDFDLANGVVSISLGLFVLLVGLSVFGLIIAGSMFATAIAMISQKRENVREIRRFNAMMLELQDTNRIWYGTHSPTGFGFEGLEEAVAAMEVDKEFLEDRD